MLIHSEKLKFTKSRMSILDKIEFYRANDFETCEAHEHKLLLQRHVKQITKSRVYTNLCESVRAKRNTILTCEQHTATS